MPLSNFTRPVSPYENNPLPRDNKFRIRTRIEEEPIPDQWFDDECNSSVDRDNELDQKIEGLVAGIIPGSNNPLNAGKFVTTDGHEVTPTLSFVFVTNNSIQDGTISGVKLTPLSIGTAQLDNGIITNDKVPNGAFSYSKMNFQVGDIPYAVINVPDGGIPGSKITGKSITQAQQGLLSVGTGELINASVTLEKLNGVIDVAHGGTGLNTLVTAYGVVCAGTTPTGNFQNAGAGTANQVFMSNGNAALPSFKNLNTLAASKADQIAANSNALYTNPLMQQHHPSANKFSCNFDGALAGTNAPRFGYNVASVQRISTGFYQINFIVPFANTNYVVKGCCQSVGVQKPYIIINDVNTNWCRIEVVGTSLTLVDTQIVCLEGSGLQ